MGLIVEGTIPRGPHHFPYEACEHPTTSRGCIFRESFFVMKKSPDEKVGIDGGWIWLENCGVLLNLQ